MPFLRSNPHSTPDEIAISRPPSAIRGGVAPAKFDFASGRPYGKPSLNAKFDRLLSRASMSSSTATPVPKRRRVRTASSPGSTTINSESSMPRTPVNMYDDLEGGRLGEKFSLIKHDAYGFEYTVLGKKRKRLYVEEEGEEDRLRNRLALSSTAPSRSPIPAWLSDTFSTLSPEHPLRHLAPPSPPLIQDAALSSSINDHTHTVTAATPSPAFARLAIPPTFQEDADGIIPMPFADNTGPMFSDAYSSTTATIFSPTNLLNYDTPSSTTPQLRFLSHHSVPPKSQADSNAAFLSDPTIVDQDAPSSGDEDFTNFPSENWPFRSPGPSGLPLARQRLTPPQIFPAQVKGLSPIRYNNLVYETPYNSAEYFSDNSLDPSHSPPTAIIRSFGNVLHHPSPRKLVSLESLDSSPSIAVPDSRYNHFASTHEVADHPPSGDATASHVPFDCPSEDADSLNRCGDISGSELRAPGFLSEPDFDENKENESPFALDVALTLPTTPPNIRPRPLTRTSSLISSPRARKRDIYSDKLIEFASYASDDVPIPALNLGRHSFINGDVEGRALESIKEVSEPPSQKLTMAELGEILEGGEVQVKSTGFDHHIPAALKIPVIPDPDGQPRSTPQSSMETLEKFSTQKSNRLDFSQISDDSIQSWSNDRSEKRELGSGGYEESTGLPPRI